METHENELNEAPSEIINSKTSSFDKKSNRFEFIKKDWPKYFVEVLVIILGITISFTLNNWKEQQNSKELENLYLRSLFNDINTDLTNLNKIITESEVVVENANKLLVYSIRKESNNLNTGQFLFDLQEVFKRPSFFSNDATFTDLKSSGNIHLLQDFELKNKLFNYYNHYQAIKAVELAEKDATIFIIAPYLIKRFSIGVASAYAENDKFPFASEIKETEYLNCIAIRLANREELLSEYRDISLKCESIKVAIQDQISKD